MNDDTARFTALLNAAVDAIVIIDDIGTIELFNTAAQHMFGYPAAEVIGKNVKILMPQPYRDEHDGYIARYRQTAEENIIGKGREVTAVRKDGEVFPISLAVGEVKGSSRQQFVGFIHDISARVRAEAEILESRERLSHASRLNSMGEMAAGIAHEINQPLTAISAYAQACQSMLRALSDQIGADQTEKLQQTLEKISRQSMRASDVITRLRTFVKKRTVQKHPISLNTQIEDTLELAKIDTRLQDYKVSLNLANNPTVFADPVQLQQVLLNLIRNAVDAMEDADGDTITVKSLWRSPDQIEISVCDQGIGVDENARDLLFTPFATTKASGMGIGLPICQSIVHAHGGELHYHPGEGGGSVFSFTLPASRAQTQNE